MKYICLVLLIVGTLSIDYQISTVPESVRKTVYSHYDKFLNKTIKDNLHNFVLPGLGQDFVPQGFAETSDSFVVTAYYNKYGSSTTKNSKLYLISKSTGKVTRAVALDTTGHVGGVAASSSSVYVCVGSAVGEIAISTIKNAKDEAKVAFKKKYSTLTTCSFASYYKDRLYVGSFDETSKQTVHSYTIKNGTITNMAKYIIPKKIQGFTVLSDTKIAASQSYGRNNNSTLIVYTVASAYKSTDLTSATSTKYNLPPMSEGIFTGSDKNLYILFESGANYYYKGPKAAGASYAKNPMDRAIAVSISKV